MCSLLNNEAKPLLQVVEEEQEEEEEEEGLDLRHRRHAIQAESIEKVLSREDMKDLKIMLQEWRAQRQASQSVVGKGKEKEPECQIVKSIEKKQKDKWDTIRICRTDLWEGIPSFFALCFFQNSLFLQEVCGSIERPASNLHAPFQGPTRELFSQRRWGPQKSEQMWRPTKCWRIKKKITLHNISLHNPIVEVCGKVSIWRVLQTKWWNKKKNKTPFIYMCRCWEMKGCHLSPPLQLA